MNRADYYYKKRLKIGGCTLYHGNSLELLPRFDLPVAAIITDPPYEDHMHNAKSGGNRIRADGYDSPEALDFESITDIRKPFMKEAARLCGGWFLAFCTPEGVAAWRDEIELNKMKYKRACVWHKPDSAPQFNGQGPAMAAEMFVAAWNGIGHSKWNGGGRRNVFTHPCNPSARDGRHPTEKPLSLMVELIQLFTNPGDLILDPFMGSGSTILAAAMTGRRAIGIEKDQKYFDVAVDRMSKDIFISAGLSGVNPVDKIQSGLFES